jgi:hypothetical protein
MNIDDVQQLLQQLPQANQADLMRMSLRLQLESLRDDLERELETEDEAWRLDAPVCSGVPLIPCMAPLSHLASFLSSNSNLGTVTHVVLGRATMFDVLATPSVFKRAKHLDASAKVQGFLDRIPVILDRTLPDDGFIRYENDLFESTWVEIMVSR